MIKINRKNLILRTKTTRPITITNVDKIENLIINSTEYFRKKSKKRQDESGLTEYIYSKDNYIDKTIVENRINRFIENGALENKQTDSPFRLTPLIYAEKCGKIRIRKSHHYGGQAMQTNRAIFSVIAK